MWQSLVLPQFLVTPKGVLWRQRKPHRYGPITPRERRVTVVERSTGDVVLTFVAPAGEDAQEIVAALHHDYMRDTADEWRDAWLVDLTSALGSG